MSTSFSSQYQFSGLEPNEGKSIKYTEIICPRCSGSGLTGFIHRNVCTQCGGSGDLTVAQIIKPTTPDYLGTMENYFSPEAEQAREDEEQAHYLDQWHKEHKDGKGGRCALVMAGLLLVGGAFGTWSVVTTLQAVMG